MNVDGSWQVVLARHPWIKRMLVGLRLLPARQAAIPWSRDVVRLDLRRPLPFQDGSFDVVYSSHTLEHLYFEDAGRLLAECYRVLRPAGICRMVVPDLASMVGNYLQAKSDGNQRAGNRLMEQLLVHDKGRRSGPLALYYQLTAFHQHKWMYDAESLGARFADAGFSDVKACSYLESGIARIADVEDPGRILNGEGIVVEGRRS